ncbi:MAG: hypothetical protein KAS86_05020 [Candidatus Omnitrophica bacterium]|nr:hypothetical protein [Candidatus Omnitrophota bacterium]
MLHIIISLDYEIFGRGAGDVKRHMIMPTERILNICEKHNAPLTIMFEACEYLKFEEFDDELLAWLGYSPAELIRGQVRNALRNGHDVQLHIHPQWIDAGFKAGKWDLNVPGRAINDLPEEMIHETLKKGKEKIVSIAKDIAPHYKCNTVRFTGSRWIEAPPGTHAALEKSGIKAHSLADYCPDENRKGYWPLGSKGKVWEVPIYSVELPKYRMFALTRIVPALYRYSVDRSPDFRKKARAAAVSSGHGFLAGLFRDTYKQKWDFCKQSAAEMVEFLEAGLRRYDHRNNEVPLVMIGHSKDFLSDREFERFLRITAKRYLPSGDVKFSTFQGFVEENMD